MSRKLTLALVTTFAVGMIAGSADAASKCSGNKVKAAGKKAASKLTCLSKGLACPVGSVVVVAVVVMLVAATGQQR